MLVWNSLEYSGTGNGLLWAPTAEVLKVRPWSRAPPLPGTCWRGTGSACAQPRWIRHSVGWSPNLRMWLLNSLIEIQLICRTLSHSKCTIQPFLVHSELCNNDHNLMRDVFITPHFPWQPLICFLPLWICLFILNISYKWKHTTCGLCVWLLSLNAVFSRFVSAVTCVGTLFLFTAEQRPLGR